MVLRLTTERLGAPETASSRGESGGGPRRDVKRTREDVGGMDGLGFESRTRAVAFVPDDRWRVAVLKPPQDDWDNYDVVGWVTTPDGYVLPALWTESGGELIALRDLLVVQQRPGAVCRIPRR